MIRGRQPPRPSIQSNDSQDGGFNNYRQTQDGTVMLSPQGHPLCNHCGIPSHKRELCRMKKADREAGLTRTIHPDRDNPKQKIAKSTINNNTVAAATHSMPWTGYPNYPIVPWNYTNPQGNETWHIPDRGPNIQALVHAARLEHEQSPQATTTQEVPYTPQTPTTAATTTENATPCPYPTCPAILTDPHVIQEHIRMFHSQSNNLARQPGTNP